MLCFDTGSTMPAVSGVVQVMMFTKHDNWHLLVYLVLYYHLAVAIMYAEQVWLWCNAPRL